jgi:hypothetical protein
MRNLLILLFIVLIQTQTTCFGKNSTDSSVCNGRGKCVSLNSCNCDSNFSGLNCNFTTCNGVNSTSNNVCSSRGTCTNYNTCECSDTTSFSGVNCELFLCFGINNTDLDVCNGKGQCLSSNNCTCIKDWYGLNCQFPTVLSGLYFLILILLFPISSLFIITFIFGLITYLIKEFKSNKNSLK